MAAGYQKVLAGDEIELADIDFSLFIIMRVVQDDKKIIFERVYVRIMDGRNDGAGGQRMDFELVLQILNVFIFRFDDIHPSVISVADDLPH